MKTMVVLTALSPLATLLMEVGGFLHWVRQGYAHAPVRQIEGYLPETPVNILATPPAGTLLRGDN